jgi:hypothetical protein
LLCAIWSLSDATWAQSFRGSINGTVQDPSGSLVVQATVVAKEIATNVEQRTLTNSIGSYLFADLLPGLYRITISAPGFKEATSETIVLTAQAVQRFDVTLQLGALSERVVVEATAPTMNTENGSIAGIVSRDEMQNVPVNSRSTFNFLYLNSYNVGAIGSGNSLGGLRSEDTNFTLDGVTSNNNVYGGQSGNQFEMSLEGVGDVKLMVSNNSAEFSDVATVMVTSRAGQNQFHGSGFFLTDNYSLNASDYFTHANLSGTIDRQYGGSFGGPVLIPKLYNGHDKTFFFFSWEAVTSPTGYNVLANVPTDAYRNGDFSALSSAIKDPSTGQPFSGNIIPASRISPVSKAMQAALIPSANNFAGSIVNDYKGFNPATGADNRYQVRLDQTLSDKDSLSGRFSFRPTNSSHSLDSSYPDLYYNNTRSTYNAYISETHIFAPSVLNEFRIGYSRDHQSYVPQQDGNAMLQQFGITDISPSSFPGMPTVKLTGFSPVRNQPYNFSISEAYELLDNFTVVRGRHTLKMGISERYNRPNQSFVPVDPTYSGASDYGIFSFNGFATGYSYADFLLGIPNYTVNSTRAPNSYERWVNTGAYFQDDFRILPKLTMNLGLRWEFQQAPTNTRDFRATIDLRNGDIVVPTAEQEKFFSPFFPAVPGVETAVQAGLPSRSLLHSRYRDFAPRFGLAWEFLPKTVLRGGYGIYYSHLISTLTSYFEGGPFQSSEVYYNSISNGVPLFQFPNTYNPAAGAANGPSTVNAVDSNLKTPYVQQWNFTLERQLPSNIVVRAGYRGFQSVRLPQTTDYNAPPASADPANQNYYRYPQYSYIFYVSNGGNQKMNALDLSVERKMTNGVTFQAQYTLAKNLNNVGDGDLNFGEPSSLFDYSNRAIENANTSFQPRQRFVAHAIYELPFGPGKRFGSNTGKFLGSVIGGWQASTVIVWQTGQFYTPIYSGADITNTREVGLGIQRPDCISDPNLANPTINNWFNEAAFAIPVAGTYGNCGRGIIVGPGIANVDLGVMKNVRIKERANLQFRLTATNALNHPQFAGPQGSYSPYPYVEVIDNTDTSIASTAGSRAGQGGGNRAVQVGMRFDF